MKNENNIVQALKQLLEQVELQDNLTNSDMYVLSPEELQELVNRVHELAVESVIEKIDSADFDDCFDLDLDGNRINVNIDSTMIASAVTDEMDGEDNEWRYEKDEVDDMVEKIKRDNKKK